ncbi:MAG: hypothetical protein MSA89_06720 [Clostridium sp.]|nr:hypothetical protein [Clostridium sp.]MCI7442764.1 hypothetical protein [Clostridium sp.]
MENKNVINTLLVISSIGLTISGIIFLCVSIFSEEKSNIILCLALACTTLSNLFGIIRLQLNKEKK